MIWETENWTLSLALKTFKQNKEEMWWALLIFAFDFLPSDNQRWIIDSVAISLCEMILLNIYIISTKRPLNTCMQNLKIFKETSIIKLYYKTVSEAQFSCHWTSCYKKFFLEETGKGGMFLRAGMNYTI